MTTAAESHDAQLAAIKAKHEEVRAKLRDASVTEVEVPADMRLEQTGLSTAMVDELGRFWLASDRTMRMIFDPRQITRAPMIVPADSRFPDVSDMRPGHITWLKSPNDPDDTQAAQGFKAHD